MVRRTHSLQLRNDEEVWFGGCHWFLVWFLCETTDACDEMLTHTHILTITNAYTHPHTLLCVSSSLCIMHFPHAYSVRTEMARCSGWFVWWCKICTENQNAKREVCKHNRAEGTALRACSMTASSLLLGLVRVWH